YLSRFGYPTTLDDLAGHALIHYASTPGARPLGFEVMSDGVVQWVKTGGTLTVNSTETYQAACLAGLGIIQVPRTGVREALRTGKLIDILPQYRAAPLPVSLIYPHRRNLSRRVHLFMEWLGSVMKEYVD
ncbi:MAG: LysR substrate-binding domain-containing protein, partial [Raoultella planticola]